MNPQRLAKPARMLGRRVLIPFTTPLPTAQTVPFIVSARMLSAGVCDASQYKLFQRWSKSSPILDIKSLANRFASSSNNVFCESNGSYMYVNFGDDNGPGFSRTAVVFSDGAVITWFMPRDEENALSDVLALSNEHTIQEVSDGVAESIQVTPDTIEGVSSLLGGDTIVLTSNNDNRSDEILAISMSLASAVRMNALEDNLSRYIADGHSDLLKLLKRINNWKLSSISESIFNSEKGVHNWRYYLNNVHQNSVPDVLWEHESLDTLFQSVSNNFEINKRFSELQSSLTHYHEYLLTVGEYVRHRYSSRLEKIIIIIIAIEAALAFRHTILDFSH